MYTSNKQCTARMNNSKLELCCRSKMLFDVSSKSNSNHLLSSVFPSYPLPEAKKMTSTLDLSCDNCASLSDRALSRHRYEHHTSPNVFVVEGTTYVPTRAVDGMLLCPYPNCHKTVKTTSAFNVHAKLHIVGTINNKPTQTQSKKRKHNYIGKFL